MPIGEIVGEVVGGVVRVLGHAVAQVVGEIAIRGIGYLIGRKFKRDIDPDGIVVFLIGLGFWVIVGVSVYLCYTYVMEQIAIDRCLDTGGKFDYRMKDCINGKI